MNSDQFVPVKSQNTSTGTPPHPPTQPRPQLAVSNFPLAKVYVKKVMRTSNKATILFTIAIMIVTVPFTTAYKIASIP
jgi:hypothetical protein